MKTITMAIDAQGAVTADDLKMGRVGEHKNTRLLILLDDAFAQGIDYYRMSFGGFETAELTAQDGTLSYDVPCAATGSTVKSWQLTGYRAGEQEPTLVRKSQLLLFTLEPSIEGDNRLVEQYSESIENDITRARAALSEAGRLCEDFENRLADMRNEYEARLAEMKNTFVVRQAGKGLSQNSYTNTDKITLDAWKTALPKLEPTRVYQAEDAGYANTAQFPTGDGTGILVGGVGNGAYLSFEVETHFTGYHTVDVYYVTMETRRLRLSTNGQAYILQCPGNETDWDTTVQRVRVTAFMQAGKNTIVLDNPDGYAPNIDRLELVGEGRLLSDTDRARLAMPVVCIGAQISDSAAADHLQQDGLYPITPALSEMMFGYATPCVLLHITQQPSSDTAQAVQYIFGCPNIYLRKRTAAAGNSWGVWCATADLAPTD